MCREKYDTGNMTLRYLDFDLEASGTIETTAPIEECEYIECAVEKQ